MTARPTAVYQTDQRLGPNQVVIGAELLTPEHDAVNHPSHYTAYKGLEVIDLTEQMNFNRGNAVKYICRAGLKDPSNEITDLEKARWYIQREIERIKGIPHDQDRKTA